MCLILPSYFLPKDFFSSALVGFPQKPKGYVNFHSFISLFIHLLVFIVLMNTFPALTTQNMTVWNYLICEDGRVYEGAGKYAGNHTKGQNSDSIGIAFIRKFKDRLPNARAMKAFRNLLSFSCVTVSIFQLYTIFQRVKPNASNSIWIYSQYIHTRFAEWGGYVNCSSDAGALSVGNYKNSLIFLKSVICLPRSGLKMSVNLQCSCSPALPCMALIPEIARTSGINTIIVSLAVLWCDL